MKKILRHTIIILLVTAFVITGLTQVEGFSSPGVIYAQGGIAIDFETDPLFYEENIFPGDKFVKEVTIKNESSRRRQVAVKLSETHGRPLASALTLAVYDADSNEELLRERRLIRYYLLRRARKLFTLDPGEQRRVRVEVFFQENAPSELQGYSTEFDFSVGFFGSPARRRRPPRPPWWRRLFSR